MSSTVSWIHLGDLHLEPADGWESLGRLQRIVAQLNEHAVAADFVFFPGDNANHATAEQYERMIAALDPLTLPWRAIPGDHDFEPHSLDAFERAVPAANRPEVETIAGHRCIFLDIVSAGAGGPDFRLSAHHRNRLARELSLAEAAGEVPLVFMHAYPGDYAADGEPVARVFAEGGVAFVDTGHTHYNELLNDGRVVYGATRSTGQIEEGGGEPGFSVVCVHDRVPSWRFRRADAPWPHVQIVAPCDRRLVTRPADARQVPRPGSVRIVARVFGDPSSGAAVSVDGGAEIAMTPGDGLWQADVDIEEPGLHRVSVRCGDVADHVDVLVREAASIPKRRLATALGQECHAIGAWPEAGIEGTQLGPNKNGRDW